MSAQATLARQADNPARKTRDILARSKVKNPVSAPTTTDFSIMGTNDSSIVSKRSVELLYHAEPHFFGHFVKKPKRRAPLINRGYWLRMRAIEHELQKFLQEPTEKRKVVINLGCGYDPLPFQMLSKHAETHDVLFVDVDYPDLIRNKVAMVTASTELVEMLLNLQAPGDNGLPLSSDRYVAIGCDLSYPQVLEALLRKLSNLSDCSFCFVAEVSVTYMKEEAADALIKWASSIGDARFIQLEQCLPWSATHPFAETMLKHFAKLGTRLRSLSSYPTEQDHRKRFMSRGWKTASSNSLWKLWCSPEFLPVDEKLKLDATEPFDEWEEFALFASHYFILTATTDSNREMDEAIEDFTNPGRADTHSPRAEPTDAHEIVQHVAARSFAASITLGPTSVAMYGGKGTQSRLKTLEILSNNDRVFKQGSPTVPLELSERLCHTITRLRHRGGSVCHLLVGGRTSPDTALSDCWHAEHAVDLHSGGLKWCQVASLPHGLYRHAETALGDGVLLFGGKRSRAHISDAWYYWSRTSASSTNSDSAAGKWIKLTVQGEACQPRFGACLMLARRNETKSEAFSGFLFGGMGVEGVAISEMFAWDLDLERRAVKVSKAGAQSSDLARFGAVLVSVDEAHAKLNGIQCDTRATYALVGGNAACIDIECHPVVRLEVDTASITCVQSSMQGGFASIQGPLLVGHNAVNTGRGQVLIVGGGATCFSFGTYHNKSAWVLQWEESTQTWQTTDHSWTASKARSDPRPDGRTSVTQASVPGPRPRVVARLGPQDHEAQDYDRVLAARQPRAFAGLDLGSCLQKWSFTYLQETIGVDREVIVHDAADSVMNFQTKNFTYQKVPFRDFVDQIQGGDRKYLRSLSAQSSNTPANFWTDYPELAQDFKLPLELNELMNPAAEGTQSRQHSSVLRVSGPVSMWLHYDVMSNFLCQIHGTKRLLLYPPEDVRHLQISPGQSSSSLNMFDPTTYKKNKLSSLHPHVVDLLPGDILFIPALWLHTAQPTTGTSIAINVFFRDLDSGYAAGRDVYGNRDLQAYEDGRRDVKRIAGRFAKLPAKMRSFYLSQLAKELEDFAKG